MIIKTKSFQESCKKILDAVGSSSAVASATLELKADGQILYLNVTDKEYYVTVKVPLESVENLHAVVNAYLFLNLINKTTTSTVELSIASSYLVVKANGLYKVPLIFDADKMVEVPEIKIDNVLNSFTVSNDILQSILRYNSKELQKSGAGLTPARKLFYIDEHGAITHSNSACINDFNLGHNVVITLTERIVKLFKLFKSENVQFSMGVDALSNGKLITKVSFVDDLVKLTSIVPVEEDVVRKFPASGIRKAAEGPYNYVVTIDRLAFVESLNRLSLFSKKEKGYNIVYLLFGKEGVTLMDEDKENKEQVLYVNNCDTLNEEEYEAMFDTEDLKMTLETLEGQYIILSFGNNKSVLVLQDNIRTLIPECRVS